jgi:phytoene dehydrogenase-like protein
MHSIDSISPKGGIEGCQGAWAYPEGGMGAVSSAMAKSAISNGAHIFTDQVIFHFVLTNRLL